MGKIGSELLKLDGLVAKEVAQLKNKFEFWNIKPAINISWRDDTSLASQNYYQEMLKTLKSINNVGELSPQQQALVGIGWEFVWGVMPPEEITHLREEVKNKEKYGVVLSEQERLWLQIMAIDTDSF